MESGSGKCGAKTAQPDAGEVALGRQRGAQDLVRRSCNRGCQVACQGCSIAGDHDEDSIGSSRADPRAPIPQTQEKIDEEVKVISSERVSEHIVKQIQVVSMPQITEEKRR